MENCALKTEDQNREQKKVIIRAAVESDYEGMKRVWRSSFGNNIFGGELNSGRHFAWGFEQNPHHYKESVSQWVAEVDGKIMGAWSAMPVQLHVRGVKIAACWLQNAATAPEARRMAIARKMLRSIYTQHPLTLAVGPTEFSRPLFNSEGVQWVHFGRFVVLRLSPRDIVENVLRTAYHLDIQGVWANLQSAGRSLQILRSPSLNVHVTEIKRFDVELDAFISNVAKAVPVMTYRNAEKLNWMIENPSIECAAFVATRVGKHCGYVIMRRDGVVLDLLVHPDDPAAFTALLSRIAEWSRKHALHELSAILPGVPKLAAMYKANGFLSVGSDFDVLYAFPNIKHRDETLSDPGNWYLSLADSDLWCYRLRAWGN